jgi:hypothetical protein
MWYWGRFSKERLKFPPETKGRKVALSVHEVEIKYVHEYVPCTREKIFPGHISTFFQYGGKTKKYTYVYESIL